MSLFLSANGADVREAIRMGFAAGRVVGRTADDDGGADLRIAFDFDGVLADDSSERIYQEGTLEAYQANESALADGLQRRSTTSSGSRTPSTTPIRAATSAGSASPSSRRAALPPTSARSTRSTSGGCASTTPSSWEESTRDRSWESCSRTSSSMTSTATWTPPRARRPASTSPSGSSTRRKHSPTLPPPWRLVQL